MNLRIDPMAIELASLSGWPALESAKYDGWLLRFASGYTKRSNSVQALGSSSLPLEAKIAACEEAYAGRGLPTIFKIADFPGRDEARALDGLLASRGYERLDETSVRLLDLSGFKPWDDAGGEGEPDEAEISLRGLRLHLSAAIGEDWVQGYCAASGKAEQLELIRPILGRVEPPLAAVRIERGGECLAAGYAALSGKLAGIFDVIVRPEFRRQGLGRDLLSSLLVRARELGAEAAYLQVVSGNAPAEKLYEKLGFEELYRYWYRKK